MTASEIVRDMMDKRALRRAGAPVGARGVIAPVIWRMRVDGALRDLQLRMARLERQSRKPKGGNKS